MIRSLRIAMGSIGLDITMYVIVSRLVAGAATNPSSVLMRAARALAECVLKPPISPLAGGHFRRRFAETVDQNRVARWAGGA